MPSSINRGTKAVVFFAQESLSPRGNNSGDGKHLDELTALGQTGLLHIRFNHHHHHHHHQEDKTDNETHSLHIMTQLLGMSCDKTNSAAVVETGAPDDSEHDAGPSASAVNKRHGDMKFSIWSDSDSIIQWLRRDMRHADCHTIDNFDHVAIWESVAKQLRDTHTDVVLVHFKPRACEQERHDLLKTMDSLVGAALQLQTSLPDGTEDGEQSAIRCLHVTAMMGSHVSDTEAHRSVVHRQSLAFIPIQSFETDHGQTVSNVDPVPRIVFSSYQDGVTRKDNNTQFSVDSCIAHNGLGSILADHFFNELSYNLGLSPKYGA